MKTPILRFASKSSGYGAKCILIALGIFFGVGRDNDADDKADPEKAIRRPSVNRAVPLPAQKAIGTSRVSSSIDLRRTSQQLLNSELAFVHQICRLTGEQKSNIRAKCQAALLISVQNAAPSTPTPRSTSQTIHQNLRRSVRSAVAEVLQEALSSDQLAHFQDEAVKRRNYEKTVIVRALVASVDANISLNREQRNQLTSELFDNYDDGWESLPVMGRITISGLPRNVIESVLTERQKSDWNESQASQTRSVAEPIPLTDFRFFGEPWKENEP